MTEPTTSASRLSALSDRELSKWHQEIRRIATLSGDEALEATDTLIWSLLQAASSHGQILEPLSGLDDLDNWGENHLQEQLARIHETTGRLRTALQAPAGLQVWDAQGLRREAEHLGQLVDRRVRDAAHAEIEAARREAETVAIEVEIACHVQGIRAALTEPLQNAGTVQRVLAAIERATAALSDRSRMVPEVQELARRAKARAARYRWQKKLDEAEVAAAGGSEKRAEKLQREAAAVLAQDWARAFPGEPVP